MVFQKSALLLPQPSNSINLLGEFRHFRQEKQYLDISLICENGVRVDCHSMVLATANVFWRGVLKSLKGLGYHGIDEGSMVEILMLELNGEEVEKFVNSLYSPERFVKGKTDLNTVFLLDETSENEQPLTPPQKSKNDFVEDSSLLG